MSTFQTHLLNEIGAGHDGPAIPESKRVYFQERLRGRIFDYLLSCFIREQANGLTKAKLARRIGKAPEVVNRLLAGPSNLTLDSISDLLIGVCAEELDVSGTSLLGRSTLEVQRKASTSGAEYDLGPHNRGATRNGYEYELRNVA